MKNPSLRHSSWIIALSVCAAQGCTFDLADEGAEFREAIPSEETVAVPGPAQASGNELSATGPERKDAVRYGADGNYRTGWTDGLALCKKK